MAFKFLQIPVRDHGEAEALLNSFLRSHRILSVDRRWVDLGHDSFWSVCIDYVDGEKPTSNESRVKGRAKDYKEVLSPDDFAVFAKLRDLRKEISQAEAVPVYAIFTNEQLAKMVETRVDSATGLAAIEGVGDARIDKYAEKFLSCLNHCWNTPHETSGPVV